MTCVFVIPQMEHIVASCDSEGGVMAYLGAVYQQEGTGVSFQGRVGTGESYFMVLCIIRRNADIDMELGAYVMRRLRKWAEDMPVTEEAHAELHGELERIEYELKNYERIQRNRGLPCQIRWESLSLLVCRESVGILAVKGEGEIWLCNRSLGRNVKERLLPDGSRDSLLIEFRGQVGILLLTENLSEEVPWQEVLGGIHTRDQLQRRVKEVATYGGTQGMGMGYLIGKEDVIAD